MYIYKYRRCEDGSVVRQRGEVQHFRLIPFEPLEQRAAVLARVGVSGAERRHCDARDGFADGGGRARVA